MASQVVFAVYGAHEGGDDDRTKAADVTLQLQQRLDASSNGLVRIDNASMGGDPAKGTGKHFGAIVEVDRHKRPFACAENQTIDFTYAPRPLLVEAV